MRVPRTNRMAWIPAGQGPPAALQSKPRPPQIAIRPAPQELVVDKNMHDLDYLVNVANMPYNRDWQPRSMLNLTELQERQQMQLWTGGPHMAGSQHQTVAGYYQTMPQQSPVYLPTAGGYAVGPMSAPALQRSPSFILRPVVAGDHRPTTPTIFITKTT